MANEDGFRRDRDPRIRRNARRFGVAVPLLIALIKCGRLGESHVHSGRKTRSGEANNAIEGTLRLRREPAASWGIQ
jgi:hypothetical protein